MENLTGMAIVGVAFVVNFFIARKFIQMRARRKARREQDSIAQMQAHNLSESVSKNKSKRRRQQQMQRKKG